MKVTQVLNDDFPSEGGYQNLVTNIVRHMDSCEKITNEVICLSSDQAEHCSTGVHAIFVSSGNSKLSIFFTILYNWIALMWYLLRSKPDILHVHQSFIAGVYCWPAKLFRTKIVCTSHGKDILLNREKSYGSRRKKQRRILIYITLKLVDRHVVVSESMIPSALDAGSARSKIRVIHNGMDMNKITDEIKESLVLDPTHFNVLFVGRLIGVKRPELLIQAVNLIITDKKDIRLHYVGRGSMKDELVTLTRENRLNNAITFHGYVTGGRKWNMFRQADLVVLPSDTEAFGLVLIEAMACGTPVMAPDHGPFPEIITDLENGLLYDRNTPRPIAEAISTIRDNHELQTYLGQNAKKVVKQNFTIERCVKDYCSLYNQMSSEK